MKICRFTLVLIGSLAISANIFGQKNFTQDAENSFSSEHYFSAISLYKKAYTKEKSKAKKAEILFKIGECYRHTVNQKQAETWYQKAIKAKYPDPIAHLHLADAIRAQGDRYDDALSEYTEYKKKNPSDHRGEMGEKSCKLATEWIENPTRYEVNDEVLLNSKKYDFSPTFADKKYGSLIFTSTREGSTGSSADSRTGENFSDLYFSKRDKKGKWSVPVLLGANVNTEANEGAAAMNKRFNELYFTRCQFNKKQSFGCEIYKSKKQGIDWAEAELIPILTDSNTVGHPATDNADQYIFFASEDLPGGKGGKDIWYMKYVKKGKTWSKPINAGSEVNTPWDEMFPFVHVDGSLYFASNGHMGMGGLDIFKAEQKETEKWGNVQNLKFPINTEANDFGITFEGTKDKGYLTSNRKGGKGGDDIYSFYMPPLIYALQGTVTDVDTKDPLPGAKIQVVGTDGSSFEAIADGNGFYSFEVKTGGKERYIIAETTYNMVVSKNPDYLRSKGKETTVGVNESTTFVHDFALQSIRKEEIRFPDVLYDYDKATLKPEAKDSLDFLWQTLSDNPNIVIELSSHTDSRGSDSYNEKLSQARAESCVKYLIEKGIPGERMIAQGYGETKLLIDDETISKLKSEIEKEAAHQKNRRTVFKVLRTDYVYQEGGTDGGGTEGGGTDGGM